MAALDRFALVCFSMVFLFENKGKYFCLGYLTGLGKLNVTIV